MNKRIVFLWLLWLSGWLLNVGWALTQQPTTPPTNNKAATPAAPPPAPKYPLEAWKPLVTREGNFSILLPLAVKGEMTRFQLPGGNGVETRFAVPTADGNYQAAFTFLSENLATPQLIRERFAALLKGLKQNEKVHWLSGGEIDYEGNPGIEFKVQFGENRVTTWSRQYFAFGCIYEITARYLPREPELKEPQMFLDSFKLFGPPSQRPVFPPARQESLPDFTPLAQNLYYVLPETLRAQAIEKPEPKFETEGKAYSGTVTLLITVSTEGKVMQIDPHDGFPGLYEPAIKAAKKWTFKPFLVSGRPVQVQGQLTFKFGTAATQVPK